MLILLFLEDYLNRLEQFPAYLVYDIWIMLMWRFRWFHLSQPFDCDIQIDRNAFFCIFLIVFFYVLMLGK